MDLSLARSIERVAFKKPICEHQLIQAKIADMAVKIDASVLLVYRAAWLHDAGESSVVREAAIAKLYATEAAQEVVDQAQQIFGGLGVVKDEMVERLYRHVRAYRRGPGRNHLSPRDQPQLLDAQHPPVSRQGAPEEEGSQHDSRYLPKATLAWPPIHGSSARAPSNPWGNRAITSSLKSPAMGRRHNRAYFFYSRRCPRVPKGRDIR